MHSEGMLMRSEGMLMRPSMPRRLAHAALASRPAIVRCAAAPRSILNLNSPNGFHPMAGMGSMLGSGSFSLPTAAARPRGPQPGGVFGSDVMS